MPLKNEVARVARLAYARGLVFWIGGNNINYTRRSLPKGRYSEGNRNFRFGREKDRRTEAINLAETVRRRRRLR